MGCDVCGNPGETLMVNRLLATKEIQHICRQCANKSDKFLNHFRTMAWKRTKKKLQAMKRQGDTHG